MKLFNRFLQGIANVIADTIICFSKALYEVFADAFTEAFMKPQ